MRRTTDLAQAQWRKSSRSNYFGDCVEVAASLPGVVAVRDSKDHGGPVLVFPDAAWNSFIAQIKDGEIALG